MPVVSLLLTLSLIPCTRAETAPGWALIMPLGVPQFAQHRSVPGLVFGGVQAAAFGGASAAMVGMRRANEAGDVDRELTLRLVSVGAVAVGAGAWFGSITEASHAQQTARADAARAWSASTNPALSLPPVWSPVED